jgi:hypothetical protein
MEDRCILPSDVATAVVRLTRRVPGDNREWQKGKRVEKHFIQWAHNNYFPIFKVVRKS